VFRVEGIDAFELKLLLTPRFSEVALASPRTALAVSLTRKTAEAVTQRFDPEAPR
jgi:hypothetical protein